MASKHREQKILAAVACTTCGAAIGEPCRYPDGRRRLDYGRPMVCSERRLAWQLLRDPAVGNGWDPRVPPEQVPPEQASAAYDVNMVLSPVLARLIEEIHDESITGPNAYNRIHNRHNRSR